MQSVQETKIRKLPFNFMIRYRGINIADFIKVHQRLKLNGNASQQPGSSILLPHMPSTSYLKFAFSGVQ